MGIEIKGFKNSGHNLSKEDPRITELKAIFAGNYGSFRAFAYKFVSSPEEVEDLVQETFMKAWRSLKSYKSGTNMRAWLRMILRNSAINLIRKKNKAILNSLTDDETDEEIEIEDETQRPNFMPLSRGRGTLSEEEMDYLIQNELSDEIATTLASMHDGFKQILIMADIFNLSYKDISERTNTVIGTIMSRLFRARRQLRQGVGDLGLREYGIAITDGVAKKRKAPSQE